MTHRLRILRRELALCGALNLLALLAAVMLWISGRPVQGVGITRGAVLALSVLTPAALATALLAADLEANTVAFAWSVALSRRRWLVDTVASGLCAMTMAMLPLVLASHLLGVGMAPSSDAALAPLSLDPCPLLLWCRAVAIFTVMCLIGATSGRIMTTVLVGLAASALALVVVEFAVGGWRDQMASAGDLSIEGSWPTGTEVVAFDGHIVSADEAAAASTLGPVFDERYYRVPTGLSPADRTLLIAGEMLILVIVSGAMLVLSDRIIDAKAVG